MGKKLLENSRAHTEWVREIARDEIAKSKQRIPASKKAKAIGTICLILLAIPVAIVSRQAYQEAGVGGLLFFIIPCIVAIGVGIWSIQRKA